MSIQGINIRASTTSTMVTIAGETATAQINDAAAAGATLINSVVSGYMPYGCIYCTGNTTATPFAGAGTYTNISGQTFLETTSRRFDSPTSGQLRYLGETPFTGVVNVVGSFVNTAALDTFGFQIGINNTGQPQMTYQVRTDNANPRGFAVQIPCILASGQVVSVRATNLIDTDSAVIQSYCLVIR